MIKPVPPVVIKALRGLLVGIVEYLDELLEVQVVEPDDDQDDKDM